MFTILFILQNAGIESAMLENDKLWVVLVVVLVIWVMLAVLIFVVDRQITRIESSVKRFLDRERTAE
ncbi:MAG: hypothetical protein OXE92_01810 [Bacteroidetes bacterium]|nr:hypothetical protein [Bacteroidota bacterium]MCY4204443.1 hypothetical protein [Bacteroidota bacterium]